MPDKKAQRPVRVGVFSTVAAAGAAVQGLLDAGFTKEHVSVVCSDQTKERFFREFEHDLPAGTKTESTAVKGGVVGAVVGGLAAVTGLALTGGIGLVALGPLLVSAGSVVGTGAVFGTFVGAMMSRGFEREVANFYDQALRGGELLVAAEIEPDGDPALLARAETVFREFGARPLPLPEG